MPHNPYTPPTSQVEGAEEKTPFDFSGSTTYSITPRQLWLAGMCSILGILLTPPYVYFVFMKATNPAFNGAALTSLFVLTALSVYTYIIFKKLLNEKSHFRAANLGISLCILASVISALVEPFINHGETISTYTAIELVVFGVLLIYLGLMLLRCEDALFGQMKLIAYLTIASGITTASIVLTFLAVLLSFPLGIATAKLFFRASKALAQVQN